MIFSKTRRRYYIDKINNSRLRKVTGKRNKTSFSSKSTIKEEERNEEI